MLDVFRSLWKFFLKQGGYGPILLLLLQTSGHLVFLPKNIEILSKLCVWVVRLNCVLTVASDSCVNKRSLHPTRQFLLLSFDEQRATLTWNVIQFDVVYNWTRYNENKINNSKCMAFLQRKPNGIEMSRWLTDQFIDRFYICLRLVSNDLLRKCEDSTAIVSRHIPLHVQIMREFFFATCFPPCLCNRFLFHICIKIALVERLIIWNSAYVWSIISFKPLPPKELICKESGKRTNAATVIWS